ncbi:MAG: ankyrin repeat domain-containing protein, partial [Vicinamibacteria bacterium]
MRATTLRAALLIAAIAVSVQSAPLGALSASSAVADAAMAGDRALVRTLLQQGGDVSAAQGDGMTALHWAAMHGDAEMAEMLLYAGANTRSTTRLGAFTALHVASSGGAAPVVRRLVDAKSDIAARTATGATPLMLAAASGSVEAVTILLDAGADANARETANEQTALMFAAARDRHEVVRALVARGADVTATSKFVDLAALSAEGEGTGRPGQGAAAAPSRDIPGVTRGFRYNELIGAQGGLTALHFASRQGALASVRALVEGGADVNQLSPGDRTSPLVIATINGHFDIAMYLLERGADPNAANQAGVTPLYGAINVQWAPIAAYPQPRAHLQQASSYMDLAKALLAKGADPNARLTRKVWFSSYNFDQSNVDEIGATPFWRAAYASDVEMMRVLVAAGADPNIATMATPIRRGPPVEGDEGGPDVSARPPVPPGGPSVTPLQAAAGVGYGKGFAGNSHHVAPGGMMAAVKYLIEELGADVNAADHEGNTAIHHAAARGDNDMILYLVSKGADPTVVNRRG